MTTYTTHLYRHFRKAIGLNLRQHRRDMTLNKLSRLSGLSVDLLDCYELGKGDFALCELMKIACALRVNLAGLLPAD